MSALIATSLPLAKTGIAPGASLNGTKTEMEASYPVLKFMESFCLISSACGMVGNGIVIWFLGFCIKRNPYTVYILNLAVSDFGYLLCIAIETVQYLMQFNVGVKFGIFLFLDLFMYGTGLYLLTTISIERCLSVLCPVWFRCHRPKHLSSIMSVLLWALSFLVCGLGYISCSVSTLNNCQQILITIGVLDFLICTPLMVLSSLILFFRVRCSSRRFKTGRLFTVILLTILFFLIFAVPLGALLLLDFWDYKFLYSPEIGFVLSCINSSLNPVIYFLVGSYRDRRFRDTLRVALQKVFEEEVNFRDEQKSTYAEHEITKTSQ